MAVFVKVDQLPVADPCNAVRGDILAEPIVGVVPKQFLARQLRLASQQGYEAGAVQHGRLGCRSAPANSSKVGKKSWLMTGTSQVVPPRRSHGTLISSGTRNPPS